jgi:hypothetical protein
MDTERKIRKEAAMLSRMVQIYCDDHHVDAVRDGFRLRGILAPLKIDTPSLCVECSRLLTHGLARLVICPFDPKPSCKHCTGHCYTGEYRKFVKIVMRYSGLKLIKSGRLDLLFKFLS